MAKQIKFYIVEKNNEKQFHHIYEVKPFKNLSDTLSKSGDAKGILHYNKFYDSIDENNFYKNKLHDVLTYYPIISKNELPTYKELIDSLIEKYSNMNLCIGYLKKSQYKEYSIGIIYLWTYELLDKENIHIHDYSSNAKNINDKYKRELYERLNVIKIEKEDDRFKVFTKEKPTTDVAYMWEWGNIYIEEIEKLLNKDKNEKTSSHNKYDYIELFEKLFTEDKNKKISIENKNKYMELIEKLFTENKNNCIEAIEKILNDDKNKYKKLLGTYENEKIFTEDKKILTLVEDLPTLHSYAFRGFFKPDLIEVISQISHENIKDKDFYVTTEIFSNGDPSEMILGQYHVGITKVFV